MVTRIWHAVCAALLVCTISTVANAACRQALAIGMDVSGSVDAREHRLQTHGLADALSSRYVADKLLLMPNAPVRLFVFEWSGAQDQTVVVPWTDINSQDDIDRLAARLKSHPRRPMGTATAVGSAMNFGATQALLQKDCWQHTLDVSGDGIHITGPHPRDVRARLADTGLRINGLVIGVDRSRTAQAQQLEIGELSSYYNAFVILGPDAFVETALGFEDFARAMTRKLEKELAGLVIGMAAPAPDHPLH